MFWGKLFVSEGGGCNGGATILDLILTKREELVESLKVEGSLGKSVHRMLKFIILSKGKNDSKRIKMVDFKNADFNKPRELVNMVPWEGHFREMGVQKSWQFLKQTTLKAQ